MTGIAGAILALVKCGITEPNAELMVSALVKLDIESRRALMSDTLRGRVLAGQKILEKFGPVELEKWANGDVNAVAAVVNLRDWAAAGQGA